MTSTASTTNQNPATTTNAPAASYASAAGANTKPTSPLIATGSQTPVVVGSTSTSQNASQQQPLNGGGTTTVTVTPAVPSAAPPVARGSSIVNGGSNHGHTSSVTISAPASHIANGGPVGNHKNIQFGFPSPQGTPHMAGAVPIPITGSGNHRIPSPAHSPSPIPQVPQQSGGQRAPNMSQVPPPTFGSFPGDNDVSLATTPGPPRIQDFRRHLHMRSHSSHYIFPFSLSCLSLLPVFSVNFFIYHTCGFLHVHERWFLFYYCYYGYLLNFCVLLLAPSPRDVACNT